MQFNQRQILITGASGGIGAALARALAAEKAALLLHGRDTQRLSQLAAECGQLGAQAVHTCCADLTTAYGREHLARSVQQSLHGFDLLINNAGISEFRLFELQTADQIERQIQTNVTAPILLTHRLLPILHQASAPVILNIGSAFGAIGYPGFTPYCTSKGAMRLFSEALARELADTPMRVQYLAPRATRTNINSAHTEAMLEATGSQTDSPEQVAKQALRLLRSSRTSATLGWPERLLVRLNGLVPELLNRAIRGQLNKIKPFASTEPEILP